MENNIFHFKSFDRMLLPTVRQRLGKILLDDEEVLNAVFGNNLLMQMLSNLNAEDAMRVLQVFEDTLDTHVQSGGGVDSGQVVSYLTRLTSTTNNAALSNCSHFRARESAATTTRNRDSTFVPRNAARMSQDRISPTVQKMLEDIFHMDGDRAVMEDSKLMLLLAKIPEEETCAALQKYQQDIEHHGRDFIINPCGYLISLLKKAQQDMSNDDPSDMQPLLLKPSKAFRQLSPKVRAQLVKTFGCKRDRSVLEDIGLLKQLGRLDEANGLEAIANYREAASRRGGKSILNPSAYFMVILREFIEGTMPLRSNYCAPSNQPSYPTSQFGCASNAGMLLQSSSHFTNCSVPRIEANPTYYRELSIQAPSYMGCSTLPPLSAPARMNPYVPPFQATAPYQVENEVSSLNFNLSAPYGGAVNEAFSTGKGGSSIYSQGFISNISPYMPHYRGLEQNLHSPSFKIGSFDEEVCSVSGSTAACYGNRTNKKYVSQPLHIDSGHYPIYQWPQANYCNNTSCSNELPLKNREQKSCQFDRNEEENLISRFSKQGLNDPTCDSINPSTVNSAGSMSQNEVQNFLKSLRLEKYADIFAVAEVDMQALMLFGDTDLKELNLPKGPRIKILHALHGEAAVESSIGESSCSSIEHVIESSSSSNDKDLSSWTSSPTLHLYEDISKGLLKS